MPVADLSDDDSPSFPLARRYHSDLFQPYWDLQRASGVPRIVHPDYRLIARLVARRDIPLYHRVIRWAVFLWFLYYLVAFLYTALR
jgi:hypothetical protein